MRPPIEHYARCSVTVGALVVEPGIELRECDDFDKLVRQLRVLAEYIGAELQHLEGIDRMAGCRFAAAQFEDAWPGRAFFIELHDAEHGVWSQTYQPYGMPRDR